MEKYSRILKYVFQHKGKIAQYFVFIILSIIFGLISLGLLAPFFDLIFKQDSAGMSRVNNPIFKFLQQIILRQKNAEGLFGGTMGVLAMLCIIILVSILLKNLFLYLSLYILNPLKHRVINNLRVELFSKILLLPIGYFSEQRKGDLVSRVTNDVNEVEVSIIGAMEGFIRDPITIVLNLLFLFIISPQLTIFILLAIPLIGFVIGKISRSLKKHSSELSVQQGEVSSVLDETLGGLRILKAFGAEGFIANKFLAINRDYLKLKNKIAQRKDLASPLSEFMGVLVFTAVLWFGGRLILKKEIALDPSLFIGYLALFYNIITPVKNLSGSYSNMRKGSAALTRIEEVLNIETNIEDLAKGKELAGFNHSIEFKNVSFGYNEHVVLENINIRMEKGKMIALVGSSGAGKSTLVDLIPRFYDVTGGEILLDGVNIKEYSLQSLRGLMSIVSQEAILFNDTIANNIGLGQAHAQMHQIEQAAKIANAHNFVAAKPDGYDTNIGDRGNKLSGGEKQRLTIARAVLRNPPILILDEATSALDSESEKLVQEAIHNLMQNRTSIVIAHRLSTIKNADEIIVLAKGKIVERGGHEALIELNGAYKKLVEMQEVK